MARTPQLPGRRCAIYTRVSTEEQERGYSLEAQVQDCRAYADRHSYRLVRVLSEVHSGREWERPKIQFLLQLAERGAFDILVLWRRDRLGRSTVNNGLMERVLKQCGVRIESISVGPQQDSAMIRFQNRVMDAVAELEVDTMAERTQRARLEMARKGYWPTGPMFGWRRAYDVVAMKPLKELVVHEEEAAVIRAAYDAVIQGRNLRDVAQMMACRSHVSAINRLHRTAYKGQALYAGVLVPVPAIVSEDVWERAQRAIESRCNAKKGMRGGDPEQEGRPGQRGVAESSLNESMP